MIEGRLEYSEVNDRYRVLNDDIWEFEGLHCGETLEVLVDGEWISSRIEMAWDKEGSHWYLVNTPFWGNLKNVRVRY